MKSRTQGFTLVELLVVIGISVLLFTLLFVPMRSALDALSQAQARNELQRNAQAILARMTAEFSQAVGVFNNDAPRTTVIAQGAPVAVDLNGDGTKETYSTLQVADTSGFDPGMTIIIAQGNNVETATIVDVSKPTNDSGVCANGYIFPNIPPDPTAMCSSFNVLLVGVNSNTNNKQLTNTYTAGADVAGPFPYVDSSVSSGSPLAAPRVSLNSRVDFVLPAGVATPSALWPVRPETWAPSAGSPLQIPLVVTYYVRPREPCVRDNQDRCVQTRPYDPVDNPLLLYRAQYVPRLWRPSDPNLPLRVKLNNGCWRVGSVDFEVTSKQLQRENAADFECNPDNFEHVPTSNNYKVPVVVAPSAWAGYSHNTLVPIADVDVVGRFVSRQVGNQTVNELVTDTNFIVHRDGGRTRVTITLTLGRFDRSKSKFHKVQVSTDVDINNAHQGL